MTATGDSPCHHSLSGLVDIMPGSDKIKVATKLNDHILPLQSLVPDITPLAFSLLKTASVNVPHHVFQCPPFSVWGLCQIQ